MESEQKTSLNNKTTLSTFSGFTLSTSTNGKFIQQIMKLHVIFLFQVVLIRPLSPEKPLKLSGIILKFSVVDVTRCLF